LSNLFDGLRLVPFSFDSPADGRLSVQVQPPNEENRKEANTEKKEEAGKEKKEEDSLELPFRQVITKRRMHNLRKSMLLSLSIDSQMALPDELVISKQKVPAIRPSDGSSSLQRELQEEEALRGIEAVDQLLEDDEYSIQSAGSLIADRETASPPKDSKAASDSQANRPETHTEDDAGEASLVKSSSDTWELVFMEWHKLREQEILERLAGHTSSQGKGNSEDGPPELSGHRVTQVMLQAKTTLNLSYRGLGSLNDDLFQLPTLTMLDLKANALASIPNEISRLISLTSLDLSRCFPYLFPPDSSSLFTACGSLATKQTTGTN